MRRCSAGIRGIIFWVAVMGMVFAPVAALAALDQRIYDAAVQEQAAVLQDLSSLVSIDSPAEYVTGINQVQEIMQQRLEAIGAQVQVVPSRHGANNLVAVFTGKGQGRILLMAHADTVFPKGTAAKRPFATDGTRAYGPGIADDKGCIIAGYYALKIVRDQGYDNFAKLTFVINVDEEVGSPSSKALFLRLAPEHDYALCLEGGTTNDGIVTWRKGAATLLVEAKGRAAHAGNAAGRGINAVAELASHIDQLNSLGDAAKGTTVNFTVFKGGDKVNVIPEQAMAKADIRVLQADELDRIEAAAKEIVSNKKYTDSQLTVTLTRGRPPFAKNSRTEALAKLAQQHYEDLGLKLQITGSGGASDGNYTAIAGTPTLDGLGFVGGQGHTSGEYIEIKSIVPRLYLLTKLLMDLGNGAQL